LSKNPKLNLPESLRHLRVVAMRYLAGFVTRVRSAYVAFQYLGGAFIFR